MHRLFQKALSEYANVTHQKIADQKRVMINNRRLTELEIEVIKEHVKLK